MPLLDILLHMKTQPTEEHMRELQARGLQLVSRLSDGTYRVRGLSQATLAELAELGFVETASILDATEKLDPYLREAAAKAAEKFGSDDPPEVPVALVALDPEADRAATLARLEALGEVVDATERRVVLRVPAGRLTDVAAVEGVVQVELEPRAETQNNVVRTLTKAEPIANTLGLDGNEEVVGVADTGLDTGVAATVLRDFAGRVVRIRATVSKPPADGADLNNHGTHVVGSILGDGASSNGTLRGLAPAARLSMLAMGPDNSGELTIPPDLVPVVFEPAYDDGARIHSNSWGVTNHPGEYTIPTRDVDEFVFHHPDLLVVVAVGNTGPPAQGASVLPPGTAKNCLTVGASKSLRPLPSTVTITPNLQDNDHDRNTARVSVPVTLSNFQRRADDPHQVYDESRRGPVRDSGGRIKPDIVAPGTFVLSTRSTVSTADLGPDGLEHTAQVDAAYADDADGVATHAEAVGLGLPGRPIFGSAQQAAPPAPLGSGPLAQENYCYLSGTSMATAVASGAVTLLRQYLRQHRGVDRPSAALMKALILNSATVPDGESPVPDNVRGFGWLDLDRLFAPAPAGSRQLLVDDRDQAVATGEIRTFPIRAVDPGVPLRVTLVWSDSPGVRLQNRLYLRLLPPSGGAALDGDVTAFPHASNNAQRVHIDDPGTGVWTIQVHGIGVSFPIPALAPSLCQDFALAISNANFA